MNWLDRDDEEDLAAYLHTIDKRGPAVAAGGRGGGARGGAPAHRRGVPANYAQSRGVPATSTRNPQPATKAAGKASASKWLRRTVTAAEPDLAGLAGLPRQASANLAREPTASNFDRDNSSVHLTSSLSDVSDASSLTGYSPAALALIKLHRQQLQVMQSFVDMQKRLAEDLRLDPGPRSRAAPAPARYTTWHDTEAYLAKFVSRPDPS
ncbi:uncharacterized protein MONBRDRAFT_8296 [Monosiga brevicollis MX1]|uniref:DUF4614 domain-containing protein n=1 Tax=Monosiga brevicollis TaxID=81824 RepID=A9UZM4_MONBE|nr:uncharacterized protein MONBRDRAFT_8296 [Monosiga brevicollis MX1]EDQ89393.1 predicted protein [Monosiga brevicollis MX1]|eukprot:XP_001745969.1 hypothetical protein [Monosiga brevicollis MX1]